MLRPMHLLQTEMCVLKEYLKRILLLLFIGIGVCFFVTMDKRSHLPREITDNSRLSTTPPNTPDILPTINEETNEFPWNFTDSDASTSSFISGDNARNDTSPSPDLIEFSEPEDQGEDEEMFSTTLDEYVENAYLDKINEFKQWVGQTVRKLKMLNELSEVQNFTERYETHLSDLIEKKRRRLTEIGIILARRNARKRTYYLLLFDLERFLSTTPSGLLVSSPVLCRNLCDILVSWLANPCFEVQNFPKFKSFLKEFFQSGVLLRAPTPGNPPIKLIYDLWKKSLFFDETRNVMITRKRDFSKAFYFGFLMDRFDEDLKEAIFPLQTITELGRGNISVFHDFLVRHNIPYSGPYQAPDYFGGKKIIYFLSSCDPADNFANGLAPLFGSFTFNLNSLQMPMEDAVNFWNNLEIAPFWLLHIPPIFNLSLESMRQEFNKLQ